MDVSQSAFGQRYNNAAIWEGGLRCLCRADCNYIWPEAQYEGVKLTSHGWADGCYRYKLQPQGSCVCVQPVWSR